MRTTSVLAAIILMVAVFIAGRSSGQDKTAPPPDVKTSKKGMPAGWLKISPPLTAAQKDSIYKINGEMKAKVVALEKQIADLKMKAHSDMAALLTDAQRQSLVKNLGITPAPAAKEEKKQ